MISYELLNCKIIYLIGYINILTHPAYNRMSFIDNNKFNFYYVLYYIVVNWYNVILIKTLAIFK
jgi:hypothetical protein